jgi:hypothetical protein
MRCKYIMRVAEPRKQHQDDERLEKVGESFYWPVGTVEDHPKAYMLVRMGVAEPDDDECRLAAAMTSTEMKTAQRQHELVSKGIQPDDYQRYLDGEIVGYDEDGNDIPGPNYVEPEQEDDEE